MSITSCLLWRSHPHPKSNPFARSPALASLSNTIPLRQAGLRGNGSESNHFHSPVDLRDWGSNQSNARSTIHRFQQRQISLSTT
ncbi:hypothetical protein IQ268_27625 [Oculatella sp. LEGE 06141]|uniref:hypothetical protein n=1 Tax=Oculatella sp. LEGE 06141 TaxID=1828648 RepID=UPI001882A551|nr:hypothetical protein [Oculatella sp. LEGE 06141]MBE9182324.1 hypothetical protein [Oculatella sp. LEGE 06141]